MWQGPEKQTCARHTQTQMFSIRRNEVVYQTLFVAHACALCIVRVFYDFHLMTLTPVHVEKACDEPSFTTDRVEHLSMLSIFRRKPLSPHIKRNDVGLTPLENGTFDIHISNDFGLFFSFGFHHGINNSEW